MSQHKKSVDRKITLIASTGAIQTIDRLFRDRDDLEWLLAIGRNCDGEIYFYDSGGDNRRYGHFRVHKRKSS